MAELGEDLREHRGQAGLSQRAVAAATGVSAAQISRIERGVFVHVAFETLAALGAAVGLDVSLRAWPTGDRLRDAGHLRLLAAFRGRLPRSLRHRTEVPIAMSGDLRAWDEVIQGPGWSIPVEAETRLRDTQALRRRVELKRRDAGAPIVLLVVAATRHNRHVLRTFADEFAESFPGSPRDAWSALSRAQPPTRSTILLVGFDARARDAA